MHFTVGVTNETARCSDDGEPAQTAGKPMLDVLMGQQLKNTVVVVTRMILEAHCLAQEVLSEHILRLFRKD